MSKEILKSIKAVFVGFVAVAILSIGTDFVLERLSIFPDSTHPELYVWWMLAVALIYRSVYTIVGGYITARLAPMNPMKHVYTLMIIGGIGGILGAIGGWSYGNHWYPVLLAITGPIFVWVGGKFFKPAK